MDKEGISDQAPLRRAEGDTCEASDTCSGCPRAAYTLSWPHFVPNHAGIFVILMLPLLLCIFLYLAL